MNRVWDTPDNGYAEKFKHTIEPFLGFQRTTSVDNFDRVVAGVDAGIIGGVTSYAYGVNNRLYAKRRIGQVSQALQILSVAIVQTYYYRLESGAVRSHLRHELHRSAAEQVFAGQSRRQCVPDGRLQRNPEGGNRRRGIASSERFPWAARRNWSGIATDVSWNQRFFIAELDGFNDPNSVSRSLNAAANAHTQDNRYGATYTFTYDVVQSSILQQSIQGYYNAQCCGFSFQVLSSQLSQ